VLLWGSVFSPDSESLLLIDKPNDQHTDTHLTIWHLKDYRMSKELSLPIEKDFFATRVSSDLRYLVAWSHHDIELWSLETGEVLRRFC
jgi:hypothetical protein